MDFKVSSHSTELTSSKKNDPKKLDNNDKTQTVEEGLVVVATLLSPVDPVIENGEALFDVIFSNGTGSPVVVPLTAAELELARRGEYTIHDFSTLSLDSDFRDPREGEKDFKFAGYIPGRFYDVMPEPNFASAASSTNLTTKNEGMESLQEEAQDACEHLVGSWVGEASDADITDEDEIAEPTTHLQVDENSFNSEAVIKTESLFADEEYLMLNWKNGTCRMMPSGDFTTQSVQLNDPAARISEGTSCPNRKSIFFSDLAFPPSSRVAPDQNMRCEDDFSNGTETTQNSTSESDSKSSEKNEILQPTPKISLLTSGSQTTNVKVDDRKEFEAGVALNIQKLKRLKPGRCIPLKLPLPSAAASTVTPSRKSLRQHKSPELYGFEWMSQTVNKVKPKSQKSYGSRRCTKRKLEETENGTENQHRAVFPQGIRKKSKKRATW